MDEQRNKNANPFPYFYLHFNEKDGAFSSKCSGG